MARAVVEMTKEDEMKGKMQRLAEDFRELTNHVYGHHRTVTALVSRVEALERRVERLESGG